MALLTWFNDNYELTGQDTDIVKIKDLYDTFRQSIMWESISKADRRSKWTKVGVISAIQHNIELMTHFKDRYKKNGNDYANCLIMYRKRDVSLEEQ